MANTADILIVGLGAVGSAALYQAAKLGARAIGIDRFTPPHDHGSSHGDTRITRQAIGEGREFVPLVLRSDEIWGELEAASGRALATRNGGLIMASPSNAGSHHGSRSFVQDTIEAAVAFGILHQKLDAEEIRRQYPQFRLRGDETGYFEPGAGFLRPEACVEVQLAEARRLGAATIMQETVLEFKTTSPGAVDVRTSKGRYSAAKVILTAGPWIPAILGPDYAALFKVYRQTMNWFAVASNPQLYSPDRFPVFIWLTGDEPRDMLYGFPAIGGADDGLKISTEQYEVTVDPDAVVEEMPGDASAAMYAEYIRPRFPDLDGKCLRSQTCLYTVTPDAKFVVDRWRDHAGVVFASACSGHGFKHSAAVGEALARQALEMSPRVDLSPFRLDRFKMAPG